MNPKDDASLGASLAERLAFEQLLADLSATFANVPSDRVIDEIEHGLARLNAFLGFDRSTFWEFAANGDRVALCSAVAAGIAPVPRGPASREGGSFPGRRDVPPVLRAAGGWLRGFDLRANLRSRQRSTQGNLLSSRGEAEVRRLVRAEMSRRHAMEKK